MKKIVPLILCLYRFLILDAQTTNYPYCVSNNPGVIESITLTETETIVRIRYPKQSRFNSDIYWSSAMVMLPVDEIPLNTLRNTNLKPNSDLLAYGYTAAFNRQMAQINETKRALSNAGFLIRNLGPDKLDQSYITYKNDTYWELHFDRMPRGKNKFIIRELLPNGFEWNNITINNPYPQVPHISKTEAQLKEMIDQTNDGIVGIYESFSEQKYRLACVKDQGVYKLVFLFAGSSGYSQWKFGDVKAILEPSATRGAFKAKWYMADKTTSQGIILFKGATLSVTIEGASEGTTEYLKMYPTSSSSDLNEGAGASYGSGFALKNGYVATNYHVVDGATSIVIKGIKGDISKGYKATIAASDKQNDLAILKIQDADFPGFGTIPYGLKSSMCEVGETVWALGYPLTNLMGEEIKFTDGKISSRTGFQGDISMYQISVPIQPGNSGGALFDNRGNVVGITSAGLNRDLGTENVNYAIKTSYLRTLIECTLDPKIIPNGTALNEQSLPNQIKTAKNFIFIVECK